MTVFNATLGAPDDPASLVAPMLLTLLALLVLLFEKAVATNVSTPGHRRLSRTLDVGVIPLGMAAVILVATQFARLLD